MNAIHMHNAFCHYNINYRQYVEHSKYSRRNLIIIDKGGT